MSSNSYEYIRSFCRFLFKKFQILRFVFCQLITLGGGWVTGLFTNSGLKNWYPSLIKSSLNPPDIVFPIAWSVLYFLMGTSLYLIWGRPGNKKSLIFFTVQLFLNFIWSYLFFYCENPRLALVDIVLLWVAIVITMMTFFRLSKTASSLLIPYLVWVSFAFYLNLFIVLNN